MDRRSGQGAGGESGSPASAAHGWSLAPCCALPLTSRPCHSGASASSGLRGAGELPRRSSLSARRHVRNVGPRGLAERHKQQGRSRETISRAERAPQRNVQALREAPSSGGLATGAGAQNWATAAERKLGCARQAAL